MLPDVVDRHSEAGIHILESVIGDQRELACTVVAEGLVDAEESARAGVGQVGLPGILEPVGASALALVVDAVHSEAELRSRGSEPVPAVAEHDFLPARLVQETVAVHVHVHEVDVSVGHYCGPYVLTSAGTECAGNVDVGPHVAQVGRLDGEGPAGRGVDVAEVHAAGEGIQAGSDRGRSPVRPDALKEEKRGVVQCERGEDAAHYRAPAVMEGRVRSALAEETHAGHAGECVGSFERKAGDVPVVEAVAAVGSGGFIHLCKRRGGQEKACQAYQDAFFHVRGCSLIALGSSPVRPSSGRRISGFRRGWPWIRWY